MNCKWWSCTNVASYNPDFCSLKCANKYRVDLRRREVKLRLVLLCGGKCARCDYSKCIEALEFHHKNPATKTFAIGSSDVVGWEALVREISQCELLCATCHREEEALPYAPRWAIVRAKVATSAVVYRNERSVKEQAAHKQKVLHRRAGKPRSLIGTSKSLPK